MTNSLSILNAPPDCRYSTDSVTGLKYVACTTEEIQKLLVENHYTYVVFVFSDITKGFSGISVPCYYPDGEPRGCIQIYSKFDGTTEVHARKLLDGTYWGEW